MASRFLSFKRIIAIFLVTYIIILACFGAFITILKDNLQENMNVFLRETAAQSAYNVNSRIEQIFTSLEAVEKSFGFKNQLDFEVLDKTVENITFDYENTKLFYFNEKGEAYSEQAYSFDVSTREYFSKVMAGNQAVKNMSQSRITNQESIAFIVPIFSQDGKVLGGLGVTYPIEVIGMFLGGYDDMEIGEKLVCEDDGTIIYHPELDNIGKNIRDIGAFSSEKYDIDEMYDFSNADIDESYEIEYDGVSYFSKRYPTSYNNWQVISIVEREKVFGKFNSIIKVSFGILILVLALLATAFIYIAAVSRRTADHILKSNTKLKAFISNVPGGVFKLNIDTLIMLDLSAGLYRLFGLEKEEFYDKYFNRLDNIVCESDRQAVVEEIIKKNEVCEIEFHIVNNKNEERLLYFKGSLSVENGISYYYVILNDVTEIRSVYQEIIGYRTSLSALTDSIPGGVATFILNDALTLYNINDGFFSLVGYSRELFEALFENSLANFLTQEQVEMLKNELRNQVDNRLSIEYEFPIVNKSGAEVWLLLRGSRTDDVGDFPAFQAIFIDVTQQKQTRLELEAERERFRLMAAFTTVALFEYDVINQRVMNFYSTNNGGGNHSSIEKLDNVSINYFKNRIYPKDLAVFDYIHESLKNGTDTFNSELRINNIEQDYIWVSVEGKAIYDSQGNAIRIVGRITNIDQQKRSTQNLLYSAQRDALTGLYNKKFTKTEIEQYLTSDNDGEKSALFIIDIDNFKEVNDNFGHMFGDSVLKSVSSKLKKIFRNHDILGRVGGDEFVVFMKGVPNSSIILKKAQLICQAFETTYKSGDLTTTISSSIGISIYPDDANNYEELFEQADKALYKSKLDGKNRFSIYDKNQDYHRNAAALKRDDVPDKIDLNFTDNTIVSDLVGALYNTNSAPEDNLNVAMSILVGYYDANDVLLFNINNDDRMELIYSLIDGERKNLKCNELEFSESYKSLFDSQGFFYCSDIEVIEEKSPAIYKKAKESSIKSCLQALIINKDVPTGLLIISSRKKVVYWTSTQCSTLVVLAKIVGSFYNKIQNDLVAFKDATLDPFTKTWNVSRLIIESKPLLSNSQNDFCIIYISLFYDYDHNNEMSITNEELLIEIKNEIEKNLRDEEMFSRSEGSGFVLLLRFEDCKGIVSRYNQMKEVILSICKKYDNGSKIYLRAGSCVIDKNDKNINSAIAKANKARSIARETKSDDIICYTKELQDYIDNQSRLEENMLIALQNGEFEANYQPKIRIADGKIVGAEALARWRKDGEIYYPKDFLTVFEKYEFIEQLDYFIVGQVCKKIGDDISAGRNVLPISVNLSSYTLLDTEFSEKVLEIMADNNVSQGLIEFEINEEAFINNPLKLIDVIKNLRSTGLQFALDNYGSNYSVMNIMDTFNVNVLKISGDYLSKAINSSKKKYIIKDLVAMARKFGITVVADNVETAEMADFAEKIGCDLIQGYPYGKPMREEEFNKLL